MNGIINSSSSSRRKIKLQLIGEYLIEVKNKVAVVDKRHDVVDRLDKEPSSFVRQVECDSTTSMTGRYEHLVLLCLNDRKVLHTTLTVISRDVKQSSSFQTSVLKFEFDLYTFGIRISH